MGGVDAAFDCCRRNNFRRQKKPKYNILSTNKWYYLRMFRGKRFIWFGCCIIFRYFFFFAPFIQLRMTRQICSAQINWLGPFKRRQRRRRRLFWFNIQYHSSVNIRMHWIRVERETMESVLPQSSGIFYIICFWWMHRHANGAAATDYKWMPKSYEWTRIYGRPSS